MKRILSLAVAACASCVLGQAEAPLKDKTLVAWASPANLTQKGGSALTIDDNKTHFDGIVFGELAAAKWMAGSDGWTRSQRDQSASPAETADAKASVQMAIVYRGRQITLYRDGKEYARYEVGQQQEFGKDSTVLMGLRHLLAGDRAGFAGAIDDARIYAAALSVEQLAALKVNEPSDPKPLAWWNFQNGKPEDVMGAYPPAKLVGNARIEGGKLILDGNGSSLITPPSAAPPPPPVYVTPYYSPIHFRPDRGVLADTIPFYWKGEYHVFYLRGGVGKVPWEHIVSKDLVNWKELPTALVSDGAADGPDGEHMFTGSVTEKDGTFHIFYTGWNPRNAGGREFIMHATSPDLITWTKHPEDRLGPDGVIYKNHQDRDWRDAYVFWNADEQRHWMVMCSNSAKPEEGGVGLLTSKDLKTWMCEPPLKGADQQECPDLFKIGDTWYLIGGDHYSFAKDSRGPYQKPPVCNFIDRPGVYAAKRMFDGKRHIWTGWVWDIPTGRDGETGTWGGTQSLPREIYAGPGGQLYSKPVEEVVAVFKKSVFHHKGISVDKGSAFDVPDNYMVECQIQMEPGAELAIAMRQQPQGDAYRFVIDPGKKEASLRGPGFDYRRPCPVDASKPVKFQAFVQGTIIECFINDQYAQTCRAYNFRKGKLAFEVVGGAAKLLSLAVKTHDPAKQTVALPMLPPDPQRPVYHFTTPNGRNCIPFDPNGAVFFKGRYHLGYIYQEDDKHFWGHVSSTDLLHWRPHPPMLFPRPGDPENGIFSGNAFVDKKGRVAVHYHGCGAGNCIAFNEDDELNGFSKLTNNPVMKDPGWDPHGWLEGDTYYSISGGNPPSLYRALDEDQTQWKLLGKLMTNDMPGVDEDEDVSCPDLFKLGDKHILLCISHKRGARYYVGRFENERFRPESHFRMNWDSGACFAPETLLDDKGRRIMWAWAISGNLAGSPTTMTLPRVLSLGKDGLMRIEPVKELESLRANHQKRKRLEIPPGADVAVEGIGGDCMELQVTLDPPQSGPCGVKVRCSPDGREQTVIAYDATRKVLRIDPSKSTLNPGVKYNAFVTTCAMKPGADNPEVKSQEAPLDLKPGELLRLRIYLDKSILEVFANGRQCVTQRIWPTLKESTGVRLFSDGSGARATLIESWDMLSPNASAR